MDFKVSISIDDVNPKPGWQILGTPVEGWLRSLNEEFGAKFTCFIPSNYHQEFPLSKNKEWVRELHSIPFLELAAHGHFHQTSNPEKFGECEFFELNDFGAIDGRMFWSFKEWESVGIIPKGWKNPGWLCSAEFNKWINDRNCPWILDYISVHYEHNRGMNWNCKTFFGHDGIQETDWGFHNYLEGEDLMIMLTSHISGDWNQNVWNEGNYEQLRLSLSHLVENCSCKFKTLGEC